MIKVIVMSKRFIITFALWKKIAIIEYLYGDLRVDLSSFSGQSLFIQSMFLGFFLSRKIAITNFSKDLIFSQNYFQYFSTLIPLD